MQTSIVNRLKRIDVPQLLKHYFGGSSLTLRLVPNLAYVETLETLAVDASKLLHLLPIPKTANELTKRYLVIDLLDLLTSTMITKQNPLAKYAELTGGFADQFVYAWNELTTIMFINDPRQLQMQRWAHRIYEQRKFPISEDELQWGLLIWQQQPSVLPGPAPTSWEMALPRLMAYCFTDEVYYTAQADNGKNEFYQILQDSIVLGMSADKGIAVQHKRILYHGANYLKTHAADTSYRITPDYISARFIWFQTILYYALIRGKLQRVTTTMSIEVAEAFSALDTTLDVLLTLLSTKVSP